MLGRGKEQSAHAPHRVDADGGEVGGQAERMYPGRLTRGEELAGVKRLGEGERLPKTRAIRGHKPFGERAKGGRATLRM